MQWNGTTVRRSPIHSTRPLKLNRFIAKMQSQVLFSSPLSIFQFPSSSCHHRLNPLENEKKPYFFSSFKIHLLCYVFQNEKKKNEQNKIFYLECYRHLFVFGQLFWSISIYKRKKTVLCNSRKIKIRSLTR